MKKTKILVTGSKGQLGQAIQELAKEQTAVEFIFTDSGVLDITNKEEVTVFFDQHVFDYCINCAAYTQVDQAEQDRELAYAVNVSGVENLVQNCFKHQVKLIHISTDYVFDGNSEKPYKETDLPNPVNYYGMTKWLGEQVISKALKDFFIIRTSWLYGKGKNFVQTMLTLATTNKKIQVVSDQKGSPTYALDLAGFIFYLIGGNCQNYGTYHFSNTGETSWYHFAKEIFEIFQIKAALTPIASKDFPTLAKRPVNSSLDLTKTKNNTTYNLRSWQDALSVYLNTPITTKVNR